MWSALENAALRESLPTPLTAGDTIHDILVAGQIDLGRYSLYHLGRRLSKPYLLKQFYSLNTNAFLRWQNEARFISIPPSEGFIWPVEEWRGGLIMPFPQGMPLERWLTAKQHSLHKRLSIASELTRRVACLHQAGIRHRNLSPSAIWVSDNTLTVTEFGASHCSWWDDLWSDSRFCCSNPNYASPEYLLGHAFDEKHDIYALGGILCLLLAEQPVFGALKRMLRPLVPRWIYPDDLRKMKNIPSQVYDLTKACLVPISDDRPNIAEVDTVLNEYALQECSLDLSIKRPQSDLPNHTRQKILVFIKDDSQAVSLFDAAINTAAETPSIFLFVSLIPDNLPSGHMERFMGNLFKKLSQGLLRCRTADILWSLRILAVPDPDTTATLLIQDYSPDTVFMGSSKASGRRQSFHKTISAFSGHLERVS